MNNVEKIYDGARSGAAFAGGYIEYVRRLLLDIDVNAVGRFIETLLAARNRSAQIFFLGNGGSAATASHFANDVGYGSRSWARPFRVLSLCDNMAIVTAIANDFGYDEIFVRQLKTSLSPGDVVVGISASGNSPNVVRAIDYANAHGATTVGLTAFDGGRLKQIAQVSVHVPTQAGEYGPAEDGHMVLDHLVGAFLLNMHRAENGGDA
jgi:D-sedoheptulose 7-phosphate isomerase